MKKGNWEEKNKENKREREMRVIEKGEKNRQKRVGRKLEKERERKTWEWGR